MKSSIHCLWRQVHVFKFIFCVSDGCEIVKNSRFKIKSVENMCVWIKEKMIKIIKKNYKNVWII